MTNEQWKTVATNPDYEVSNLGQVRKGERIMKSFQTKKGDIILSLWDKKLGFAENVRVSRLVGRAFNPKFKPHLRAKFIDGDKGNCSASNLKWMSVAEVTTIPYGERQGCSKLTWETVSEIRKNSRKDKKALASHYKVSETTIRAVLNKSTWKPQHHPSKALRAGG